MNRRQFLKMASGLLAAIPFTGELLKSVKSEKKLLKAHKYYQKTILEKPHSKIRWRRYNYLSKSVSPLAEGEIPSQQRLSCERFYVSSEELNKLWEKRILEDRT